MLSVNLIDKTSDLLNLPLVANKRHLFVCPSPAIADEMRQLLSQNSVDQRPQVLTISRFIQDLLKSSELDQPVVRKSELMLPMATIWKKYDDQLSFETFQQAFTVFTELRSFTTQKELLDEVFERLDSRLNFALQIFWAYLDAQQICDEHGAYAYLTQWLKEEDNQQIRSFEGVTFFGFSHLNANQVDFIKALSLRSDVCLPFYQEVFDLTMNWDFIRWLTTEEVKTNEQKNEKINLKLVNFPAGRLNEVLVEYFKQNEMDRPVDITLLTKDLSMRFLSEIPRKDAYFKSPVSLFDEQISFISHQIHERIIQSPEGISTNEIIDYIQEQLQSVLNEPFEYRDFRKIKILQQMLSLLDEYQSLSELNEQIKIYDLKVLIDVLALDAPRVYSTPLVSTNSPELIRGVESIGSLNPEHNNILIYSGQYTSLKSGSSLFDQDTLSILSQFGPIKRKELEFLIFKKKLKEALSLPDVTLFLESGLEKTDPAWDEMLKDCHLDTSPLKIQTKVRPVDYFYPNSSSQLKDMALAKISATKLQSYLDCPQKFYYLYIENITSREEISTELRADELGVIQHKIIEDFATTHQEFSLKEHKDLSQKILDMHIKKAGRSIPHIAYQKYLSEVQNYSYKGLSFIFELKKKYPEIQLFFERKLNDDHEGIRRGSIDLFFETDEGKGIIDFKRSSGSIPTQKALLNFDKIQLWFYLNSLGLEIEDLMMIGFLNLSDPMDSLVACIDVNLKTEIAQLGVKTTHIKDMPQYLNDYKAFEKDLIEKLKNEESFFPKPKNAKVCTYCELSNICSRGQHVS